MATWSIVVCAQAMTDYIVAKHTKRGETKGENVLQLSHLAKSFTQGAVMETHFSVSGGGGEGGCVSGKIIQGVFYSLS